MKIDLAKLSDDLGLGDPTKDLAEQVWASQEEHSNYDQNGDSEESSPLPPIEDAADFVLTDLPEPSEIVKGLIHRGTKVMVGGGSKSFKTWIQLDLAFSVAYGLDWLGIPTTAGRVIFANLEIQKEFFQRRLLKIAEVRGIQQVKERLDVWNLRGHNASYRIILPQIIERIKTCDYHLIDLDPIYKLYGKTNENDASEVAELMNELERVTVQTKAALVFGAHYSKGNQSAKEAIDRVSGSGVFTRDPDSLINFTPHEEPDSFVVECILRNLPPIPPFVVTWNYPLMERNVELDPTKLKTAMGRPKECDSDDLLSLLSTERLSGKDWEAKAKDSLKMSRASFYRLKSDLKSQNKIWFSQVDDCWVKLEKK